MGKGDKKTRRGKITIGTYGVRRMRKKASKTKIHVLKDEKTTELKRRRSPREKTEVHEPEAVAEIAVASKQPVKEVKEPRETAEPKTTKATRKSGPEKESQGMKQKDETKGQKAVKENEGKKEPKPKPKPKQD
jgi:ribosomal small subunit protein bTHX